MATAPGLLAAEEPAAVSSVRAELANSGVKGRGNVRVELKQGRILHVRQAAVQDYGCHSKVRGTGNCISRRLRPENSRKRCLTSERACPVMKPKPEFALHQVQQAAKQHHPCTHRLASFSCGIKADPRQSSQELRTLDHFEKITN